MSDHTGIEGQLRRALHEGAAQMEPSSDAWQRIATRVPAQQRARRRWLLAPAAAIVALALAVIIVATRPDAGPRLHATGPTGNAAELVPTYLPAGYRAERTQDIGDLGSGFTCLDGSFAGAQLSCRRFAGSVAWIVQPPNDPQHAVIVSTLLGDDHDLLRSLRANNRSSPVTIRGHRGETILSAGGTVLHVTWSERPGVRGVLTGTARTIDLPTLLRVGNALDLSSVPPGQTPAVAAIAGDTAVVVRPGHANTVCIALATHARVDPCRDDSVRPGFARTGSFGPFPGRTFLYGAAPAKVASVRAVLRDGRTIRANTRSVDGLPGAYFVIPIPAVPQVPPGMLVDKVNAFDA